MPKRIENVDETKLISLWDAGTPGNKIAEQLKIRLGTLYARVRRLRQLGKVVARTQGQKIPSARRLKALQILPTLWTTEGSLREIAKQINYSIAQTLVLGRELHLPTHVRKVHRPLDEKRQGAIVLLKNSGWSFQDMGDIFDISRQRAHQLWKSRPRTVKK